MAESVKDLPDPLEQSASAGASSPDDLLSKMAEDAIDQLIADADNGHPPAAPASLRETDAPGIASTPTPTPAPEPAAPLAAAAIEVEPEPEPFAAPTTRVADTFGPDLTRTEPRLSEPMEPARNESARVAPATSGFETSAPVTPEPTPTEQPAPEPTAPATITPMEAMSPAAITTPEVPHVEPLTLTPPSHEEIDAVLKAAALEAEAPIEPSPLATPAPAIEAVPEPAAPQPAAEPAVSAPVPVMQMPPPVDVPHEIASADARADVKALLNDAARQSSPVAAASGVLMKPLEWLNAPFAYLSDPVRDAIGQVAIITLINALGVMLYVILFRHKS